MGLFKRAVKDLGHRPTRVGCEGCGQEDDHPRVHEIVPTADGKHASRFWHHDCFSQAHHDRQDHAAIHEIAATGLKGDALRAHLHKLMGL